MNLVESWTVRQVAVVLIPLDEVEQNEVNTESESKPEPEPDAEIDARSMRRREEVTGLSAGTIIALLPEYLVFAGLQLDSDDQDVDQDDGLEGSSTNRSDEVQQVNKSNNSTENKSEDEEPDTNGIEDSGESPDVDEVERRNTGEDVTEFSDL